MDDRDRERLRRLEAQVAWLVRQVKWLIRLLGGKLGGDDGKDE